MTPDLPRPLPIHGDPCQSLAAENARLRRQHGEARDRNVELLHDLTRVRQERDELRAELARLDPAGIRQPGPLLAVHTSDGRVYHPADVSFQYLDGPSSSPADAPSVRAGGDPIPDTAQTRSAPNGCDDCSVEPGETHRYPSCPGNRAEREG